MLKCICVCHNWPHNWASIKITRNLRMVTAEPVTHCEGGASELVALCSCPACTPMKPAPLGMTWVEVESYLLTMGHRQINLKVAVLIMCAKIHMTGWHQHGVAGSKLSVFSHSCPGVLTSTLPAGSAFSVPACLGPGAAVLEPSWVGPPPVSQLSHPQLPLSLVCLASLGNTPPGQGGLCLGHAYN